MFGTLDPLVLDLVEWVAQTPRPYEDVIEAWRTSCPRLTVWEDAIDRGFVRREVRARGTVLIVATEAGLAFLQRHRPRVTIPADA
jgi:hypothetical protein